MAGSQVPDILLAISAKIIRWNRPGERSCKCFFVFFIDYAPVLEGRTGLFGEARLAGVWSDPQLRSYSSCLCAAGAGFHELHGRFFRVSFSAAQWPREREWKWPRRNGRERGNGKEDAQKKK